jgi:hypothetical protein
MRFESDGWIVRSANKHFLSEKPHTCITIQRPGYVVAWIEPRGDREPDVHFVGMRPFKEEDRDGFWEVTRIACEFAKVMRADPGRHSPQEGEPK